MSTSKSLGFGLGLRPQHYSSLLAGQSRTQWLEALTENYLGIPGVGPGPALGKLLAIRQLKPIVLHGVSLSLGSAQPLRKDYLEAVRGLIGRVEPEWVSDHLCWTGVHGHNSHDLLPLPYTRATIRLVVERIQEVQECWQRPLLIENVSSYVRFEESEMSEAEFVREIVLHSGCGLLLDVNNIYVSSRNHGGSAEAYLEQMPWDRVFQFHLAGHSDHGDHVIDTHDRPVRAEVWELFRKAIARAPDAAVMIERDSQIPPLAELEAELDLARRIHAEVTLPLTTAVS